MEKPHISKLPEISPTNPLFWQITPPNSASPCSDRVVRFFARKDDEGGSTQKVQDQRVDQLRKGKEFQVKQQSSTGRTQISVTQLSAVRQYASPRPPEVLNRLQEVASRAQEVVTSKAQELAIRLQGVAVGRHQENDPFKNRYHKDSDRRESTSEPRRPSVSARRPSQHEVSYRLHELADRPRTTDRKCDPPEKNRESSAIRREISTGEPPPFPRKSSLKRRQTSPEKKWEEVGAAQHETLAESREPSEERPPFPLVPDIRMETDGGIADLLGVFRTSPTPSTRQIDLISGFDTELCEQIKDKSNNFPLPTPITFHRDSISQKDNAASSAGTSSQIISIDDPCSEGPSKPLQPPTIRINPPPPPSNQCVDISLVDINDDDLFSTPKSNQAETPVPPPIPARTRVGSVRSRPPIPPPRPQNQASGSSTSTNSTSSTGTTSSGGTGRKTPPPAYSELYPARRYSSERLGPPPRPSPPGRKLSEGCLPSNRKNSTGASPLRPSPLEAAARTVDQPSDPNTSPITKSHSTPASLQTIVRFHSGSTMSLHHKILGDGGSSNHFLTRGRIRYQFIQIAINAVAILAIGGALAAYFRAHQGTTVQYVNRNVTVTTTKLAFPPEVNPAPGMCLSVIVPFCLQHNIPYNYTIFPNYFAHLTQREAIQELEPYDALVDVRCYELSPLFVCSVFAPKCGPNGEIVHPCRTLCEETKRRCGFFLEVFGLTLTDYLGCDLFPESDDPNVCIGHWEVIMAERKAQKPACTTGFQCDVKRCIPWNWTCDGHVDCEDQSDELNCKHCAKGMINCGDNKCISQSHMCDGEVHCPWSQDERNCMRLSERMGDAASGKLEVYQPEQQSWRPACIGAWDPNTSPQAICKLLGYGSVNESSLVRKGSRVGMSSSSSGVSMWRFFKRKKSTNLLRQLRTCQKNEPYTTVDLTCTNMLCGERRRSGATPSKRIIGGFTSTPGDWPFLAALLGGPEQIFYCAGVLISDQWVLTASHCVGNVSQNELSGWTIQLGVTRRHSHSYFGQKAKVKRVIPHPLYNVGVAHDNDIALFKLSQRVTFHEHLLPVCLPASDEQIPPGTMCTVIGWGKKEDTMITKYEAGINEVEVPVLNRTVCNKWLEPRELNITQGMICAGYEGGGKDACQGDSGGPLLCKTQDKDNLERWFVGGIVSWGIKCAHPRLPGVYAYVPHYLPWIKQQIAQYSD